MDPTQTDSEPILIKKYGNRRLYDTSQSRYITLEDLADIVHKGATVRVVEAGSGRDLTRQVLTQVILEQQDRLDMIPVELLHAIIRTQGTLQQGPFSMFLTSVSRQATSVHNMWAQQVANMFGGIPGFGQTAPEPAAAPEAAPEPAPVDAEGGSGEPDSIEGLRDRLEALLKSQQKSEKNDS
jgi:polyhydroxyalkanoate synthesis repressor PhaR